MNCPGCYSMDLDASGWCGFCGLQVTIEQELRMKAALPPPRTKAIEEQRLDMALRNADD